jgi:YD repeat-containing protein
MIATSDALGDTTDNTYNPLGLLTQSVDAVSTITANFYDSFGNLTGTETLNASFMWFSAARPPSLDHGRPESLRPSPRRLQVLLPAIKFTITARHRFFPGRRRPR